MLNTHGIILALYPEDAEVPKAGVLGWEAGLEWKKPSLHHLNTYEQAGLCRQWVWEGEMEWQGTAPGTLLAWG